LLFEKLTAKNPAVPKEKMRLLIAEAFNGAVLPCLTMPAIIDELLGFPFADNEKRRAYTETLIDKLFAGEAL
jgi:hypothetical protein